MGGVEISTVSALQWAVARDEFVLQYQPQVDLQTGDITAMEALLRWRHPDRGLLEPREFLSLALGSDLIISIGRWVVGECLRELAQWRELRDPDSARTCELWCNVSAVELAAPGYADWFIDAIRAADVRPGTFGIEVTENDVLEVADGSLHALELIHEAGVMLAVDDFGNWYSSLASLGRLPFQGVKLNQRFVRGAGHDVDGDRVTASIIELAHERGLFVVAEGVENWTEGARLCALGCDRAHGYLFSPPQPVEQARWMLARSLGWAVPGLVGSTDFPPNQASGE